MSSVEKFVSLIKEHFTDAELGQLSVKAIKRKLATHTGMSESDLNKQTARIQEAAIHVMDQTAASSSEESEEEVVVVKKKSKKRKVVSGQRNAYAVFLEKKKKKLLADYEDSDKETKEKIVQKAWKNLGKSGQEKYEVLLQEELAAAKEESKKPKKKKTSAKKVSEKEEAPKKRAKKVSHPNKPKKGSSAWIYYIKENRPKLPDNLSFKEKSVKIGADWKLLTAEEKKPYEALAVEDGKRFKKEQEQFFLDFPKWEEEEEELNRAAQQALDDKEEKKANKESAKRKRGIKKKRKGEPKKPANTYSLFVKEMTPIIKAEPENANLAFGDVSKEIGKRWKLVTDKSKYEKMVVEAKKKYEIDIAAFNIANPPVEEDSAEEEENNNVNGGEKKKKKKKKEGPKSALTAWNCYCTSQKVRIQTANPEMGWKECMKVLGDEWKKVDKAEWEEQSKQDKIRYQKEAVEYKKAHPDWEQTKTRATSEKKTSGPTPPKKPSTSYHIYRRSVVESIQEDNPNKNGKEIQAIISLKWKGLAKAEKLRYEDQAELDQKEYQKELKKFKKANPEWKDRLTLETDAWKAVFDACGIFYSDIDSGTPNAKVMSLRKRAKSNNVTKEMTKEEIKAWKANKAKRAAPVEDMFSNVVPDGTMVVDDF